MVRLRSLSWPAPASSRNSHDTLLYPTYTRDLSPMQPHDTQALILDLGLIEYTHSRSRRKMTTGDRTADRQRKDQSPNLRKHLV